MTTINTIEDLIRLLDENPQWVEALRARLLTRELLELPQVFAQFVATTNRRFDALEERMDRIEGRMDGLEGRMDGLDGRMDRLDGRMDGLDGRMDRLQEDVGIIRGWATSYVVRDNAAAIAYALGMDLTKSLSQSELQGMFRGKDTSDIPRNELASFLAADLVMEVTDPDGQTNYIAVEASYTADERDTRRAVRNAGYMTRFTGQPASAVIAAMRIDRRIEELVASNEVYWHQLPERSLNSE